MVKVRWWVQLVDLVVFMFIVLAYHNLSCVGDMSRSLVDRVTHL